MRIIFLVLLLVGCAQAPFKSETRPTETQPTDSRPLESSYSPPELVIARTVHDYTGWPEYVWELTRRVCRDTNIPVVSRIILIDEAPIIQNFQEAHETSSQERMVIYIAGQYDLVNCTIKIWLRDPFNNKVELYALKGVLLHELMHHYYHHKGMSWPADHNELFDGEIKQLGWDKY